MIIFACYWWWLDRKARRERQRAAEADGGRSRRGYSACGRDPREDAGDGHHGRRGGAKGEPGKTSVAVGGVVDELTGLLDWRGIVLELTKPQYSSVAGSKRARLMHIHVLNLSQINYEYGRSVGDTLLKGISSAMKARTPQGWALGRLVGAEFLLIAPTVTQEEIAEVGKSFKEAIESFSLDIGQQAKASGLKAVLTPVPYFPGWGSFQEALALMHAGTVWERSHQRALQDGPAVAPHHMPQVTLGAFAAHRWETLDADHQRDYYNWHASPTKPFADNMASDIAKLLDLRAEAGDLTFVTVPPFPSTSEDKTAVMQALGQRVARELRIPSVRCSRQSSPVARMSNTSNRNSTASRTKARWQC